MISLVSNRSEIIIYRGLSHPTGGAALLLTYQGVFSRVEKPSDDINNRLFFMSKKEVMSDSYPAFFLPIATTSNKNF